MERKTAQTLESNLQQQLVANNTTMAAALEDIRQEHEEALVAKEGEIQKRHENAMSELQKKFDQQKAATKGKAGSAAKAKAMADQLQQQLKRTEKEVSFYRATV